MEEAWRDADRAARAAGVEVRAASDGDVAGVRNVIGAVWGPGQRPQPNLLMALGHAGATVGVAVRDGDVVGACLGFLGWTGGLHLHSHMAAVLAGARTAGVGYALKLWQRATCLEHGVEEVRWTFDPLVRRNARFNLVKLGAVVVDYRPDCYGAMEDDVNAGDRSDRFEVSWRLASDDVRAVLAGRGQGAAVPGDGPFVPLPEDYDALRRDDPRAARRWREEVRTALAAHWSAGLRPLWTAEGGYVFTAAAAEPSAGGRPRPVPTGR